ncbi:type VI secretion system membrane subunit TssM [Paraburkholderia hayleyella]|uniref:type VI secretion system membrane subunit TssM n=1 Tax=Paraburkholderia hayleyella TaxID=2152889 RepID=UPI0012929993|nr:type VI secretion system membrane subunit TssM [Paraburkholderia hayleyella]
MKYWAWLKRYSTSLRRWIKSGLPLLLILGLIFLLVAIWWLGPQWVWRNQHPLAGLPVRIGLTLGLLMVPIIIWASVLQARNRRLEAERQCAVTEQDDPTLVHVRAQEKSLDANLAVLRAHLRGRQGIYQLPWYLILGQEDAGKTSFVNRSGQNFSLTGEIKAGGHGSFADPDLVYQTDWWMGDQAVLIDPPGELISQYPAIEATRDLPASDPADDTNGIRTGEQFPPPDTRGRLWQHLIQWLGQNRSRRPLNGVVLIVDLPSLLGQNASERKALAVLLRTRLAELSRQLGTRPPLYVILSKFDLLEGFEPFFARLPKTEREDIFGFTFTLDSARQYDAWKEELVQRYGEFITRLNDQVFDVLNEAKSLPLREALFSFMGQIAGMRTVLLNFLTDVLGSDRYGTPALPRGVYFSSVHQQGLLHNAFVDNASQTYGVRALVPTAQPAGRSMVYFAQQVFQRVIYPEAGLAGDNLKVLADKKRHLMVGFGVAALGSAVVIGGWYHYYSVNRAKVASVLEKSRTFASNAIDAAQDPTGRNLLLPLDQLRDAVAVYGDYRHAWPLVSDMGLYQGRKIGPKIDEAYLQLLSTRYLPQLAGGVIASMNAAANGSDSQLSALRVYRMIEDKRNRRPPFVEDWMRREWQTAFPGEAPVQHALASHLDYALKYADVALPQYTARVSEVQQQLRQIPLPQRIYMAMRSQAGETLRAPLDLRNEIGPAYDIVYQPPAPSVGNSTSQGTRIDALLTAKGYRNYFEPHNQDVAVLAVIDQWVLGERRNVDYSEADKQALVERVRALYSRDYIENWRRGLNQLEVVNFDDISMAATVLGAVNSPAAPLRRLLETVRDNSKLTLAQPGAPGQPAAKPATAASGTEGNGPQDIVRIAQAFASLAALLDTKADKPSYLDETMQAIGNVQDLVVKVQDSPDRGKAALAVTLDRFSLRGTDPIGNLRRVASGLPEPLNRQVRKLADESSDVLLIEALRELEKRWNTEVFSFYNQRLARHYPFNPNSKTDASIEDFTAFFGPQGKLQDFRNKYLKLFVEDNLEALYSERRGGYLMRIDLPKQLEAADRIRDAFFNNRGAMAVHFVVEPLGLAPSRRSSVLNLQGQLITYNHGPSESIGVIWPNTLGSSNESRMTLVNGDGNSSSLVYKGTWSLFKLLSQARLNGATATSVDLSFTANDGGMRYRVTADKSNNPFTQRLFHGFALPGTLLQ